MVLLIGFQTPLDQTLEDDIKQAIDYKANYFLGSSPGKTTGRKVSSQRDPPHL